MYSLLAITVFVLSLPGSINWSALLQIAPSITLERFAYLDPSYLHTVVVRLCKQLCYMSRSHHMEILSAGEVIIVGAA